VDASCLQSHLQCSSNFAANVHRVSIALHDVPLEEMSVESVGALRLMVYVILPAAFLVSVREFLSDPATQTVHVNKARLESAHGHFGLASNRGTAVQVQNLKFGEFVRSNRVAIGRTPDARGRFHGAVCYFYAKFTALKSTEEVPKKRRKESRSPVHIPASHVRADADASAVFNACHVEAGMKIISVTTVLVWLRDLLGKGTPEHTALAPHHTDACSECVIFTTTESSLCMSLARLKQQADRALEGMSAIRELETQVEELTESRRLHRAESYAAQVECAQATSGAYHEYDELFRMFSTVRKIGEAMVLGNAMASAVVRDFTRAAKGFSFCLSKDYQMDEPILTWDRYPQPGPPYYFSKLNNYVHMHCAESHGSSTGPSRLRKQVHE
jgi:outer membrane murein-binding lipoprotein Lpp